jgi:autotransporter-associated beta strand protein
VEGGSGTWNATNTNWTNATGTADDVWAEQFAIFGTTAGTVTVEGAQAFTGMQFLTSGYMLTECTDGELVTSLADTKIRVGSGITATIATPITGSGGLSKQESGTLILSGANTYSGTTAINGGILRTAATDTLSAQSAQVVAAGAQLDLDGYSQTIGALSGSGSVLLDAATLTVGNDTAGITFAGVISSGGNLTKTGTQALILTGANTYTGLTTVEEGTLQLGNGGTSGSVAGNIQNDAELVFNRSDDVAFAGVLSGTGATRFAGGGMTTLSADSSGFGGTVSVSNGNLRIAAGGALGATLLTAGSSGTLSGLGTVVGDVSVLGTLAPGGSTLGTLTVNGNVDFDAGSEFMVRIAADGSNDALAATTVELDGDVAVSAIDTHTSYLDGQTYTILTTSSANGVSGTFDGATMLNGTAFLTPTLTHNADNVVLSIAVTADLTIVAETYNQTQTAGALNGLEQTGDALVVFNELAMLAPDEARDAFDLSSGEVHAAGQHIIDQTFAMFSRTLRDRARSGLGGNAEGFTAPMGYAPTAPLTPGVVAIDDATLAALVPQTARAWIAPLGGSGEIGADGNASGIDWTLAGLAGGYEGSVDVATGSAWFGFGLGYLRSRSEIDELLSTLDTSDFSIGAYGGWTDGPWAVSGSIAYMDSSIETSRTISFGGIDRVAAAQYWAHSIGVSGEVAYSFDFAPDMTLSPLATLDAGWSGHGAFSETGADALDLTGEAESWTRFDVGLGVALAYVMPTEVGLLNLEGRVVWEHSFADATPSQSMAFDGSPTSFSVRGPDAGQDRLHLGAGLSFGVTDDVSLSARYDGRFSTDQVNHAATIGLNVRF